MPRVRGALVPWLLLAPAFLYVVLVFVVPLLRVLVLSVTDPSVSMAHYRRIFTVPLYLHVLATTFKNALLVTVACLLLGYPLAYVMVRRGGRLAVVLLERCASILWITRSSAAIAECSSTLWLVPTRELWHCGTRTVLQSLVVCRRLFIIRRLDMLTRW